MSFFKQFPTIQYNLFDSGEFITMKNIFRHVSVNDIGLDGITSYTYQSINDGERPDILSQRLYKTPDYYWTFFILNNRLKSGLAQWPKTQRELERHLEQTHDTYSVMQFIPQTTVEDGETITFNSFSGIDMSHPYLRIRRKITNGYALVKEYRPHLLQLRVTDIINPRSFFNGLDRFVLETYNPYTSSDPKFEAAQVLNDNWLEKMLEWTSTYNNVYYQNFLVSVEEGLSRREYLQSFQTLILQEYIEYIESGIYDIGRNAPAYYTTPDGLDTTTAYSALTSNAEYPYFTTVYEDEQTKNDALASIRVVKPAYISIFAEEYKRIINESI